MIFDLLRNAIVGICCGFLCGKSVFADDPEIKWQEMRWLGMQSVFDGLGNFKIDLTWELIINFIVENSIRW